ncbi:DUF192 domain-containing protein [Candidatus Woesebacteria bacterium]|nr:MAG: DUF192 domain-containing protein [Candidatus Woesebacteria bacterium]
MAGIKVENKASFSARCVGLMFTPTVHPIYFKTRFGIHTFFVRNPIDVLILDNEFIVRKMIVNLKPWRVFLWNPRYNNVIELPGSSIVKQRIKLGSKIEVLFK